MRRVECVNTVGSKVSLTYGKFYNVEEETFNEVLILDDRKIRTWYSKERFRGFNSETNNKNKEFLLNEILSEEYINKKFEMVGTQEIFKVVKRNNDIFLSPEDSWEITSLVSKKIVNARFIEVESFSIGEVVQDKKTKRFFKIYSIEGKYIYCLNSSTSHTVFTRSEIEKISDKALNDLKYILCDNNKFKYPF